MRLYRPIVLAILPAMLAPTSCFPLKHVGGADGAAADDGRAVAGTGGTGAGGNVGRGSGGRSGEGGATTAGSGGATGTGGGGAAAGSGGAAAGSGGTVAGSGGTVAGSGGAVAGSGGAVAGSGGAVAGSGGAVAGSGGGGPPDGGADDAPSGGSGGSGSDALCRLFEVRPESEVPTVYVLVDRSGSMFNCLTPTTGSGGAGAGGAGGAVWGCRNPNDTTWAVLKTGVLDVVQQLQGVVRFGFGAFTGNQAAGMCPAFDKVDAALNNYNAISSLYGSLGAPMFKADTPTSPVLEMTKSILDADPAGGPRYILFVTDGEPDFCDDGDEVCPTDSVVRHLQQIYAAGITTFVFGIQSPLATLPVPALQAFANAGAGQPVQPLSTSPLDTYYRCMGSVPWWAEHTAAGLGMQPLGVYAATGGDARVYRPDPSDPQALTNLLASTISGVKSCVFDLVQGLRVDLGQLDRASVVIGTTTIPRDAANGWSMASETRLVLSGSACAQWRTPEVRSIDFRFPCGVVGP